jgi:type IV pilus assembly protein PilP
MTERISLVAVILALALAGCSSGIEDLQQKVAEIKSRPGERIEPLPEIKPNDTFIYSASDLRSPFVPSAPVRSDVATAVRPDAKRPREFLEQFPIDTMTMVGTLEMNGRLYTVCFPATTWDRTTGGSSASRPPGFRSSKSSPTGSVAISSGLQRWR